MHIGYSFLFRVRKERNFFRIGPAPAEEGYWVLDNSSPQIGQELSE
jgi:hypothetical protein